MKRTAVMPLSWKMPEYKDDAGYLRTSDYNYDLPKELIAQDPLEDRSSSRLMVIDRAGGTIEHRHFYDILDYIDAGDTLILNDTRVIPARLLGVREPSGGQAEILLLKRVDADRWECLVRPGKRLKEGAGVVFGDGLLRARIESVLPDGNRIVSFAYEGIFEEVLDKLGEMPLPPYITHKLQDPGRYQTVYARYDGSAAAPTAGLHFTPKLLEDAASKGINIGYVTLHVGLGTFRPVQVEDVTKHKMHSEWYRVSESCADLINATRESGHRVICVGTTSCRTVESAADDNGRMKPVSGDTSIFIYPGYRFKVMDGLITNFHLPESTLLMLVSAFAGREKILSAYKEAVDLRYRFFSFGDAMLIL